MKSKFSFYLILIFLISCQNKNDKTIHEFKIAEPPVAVSGKDLFNGKGTCSACHLADKKVIGPSIQEISKIYKEKNASIADFLIGETDPIVDPAQYEVMKENLKLLKTFSDDEIKALENYILEF